MPKDRKKLLKAKTALKTAREKIDEALEEIEDDIRDTYTEYSYIGPDGNEYASESDYYESLNQED